MIETEARIELADKEKTSQRKLNVLMVSGWVDQAFTFVRSFSKQERINLFIADSWPNSACGHSRYCKEFYLVPGFQEAGYIPALLDICRREGIDVVLPVHQEDLVEIAKSKEQFERDGFRLPIPDFSLIDLAIDKYRMAKLAEKQGVCAPRTYLLSEISPADLGRSIPMPVLIKLRRSTGQRGQKKIDSVEALKAHVDPLCEKYGDQEIIVQEYIPGTVLDSMYTVGMMYNHQHQLKACVPLKKIRSRPYTGGTAICTVARNRQDVGEMAVQLMSGLPGWVGIADVEIKIDPQDKPRFIEVNPRPWGSIYGSFVAGVDLPMLSIKVAMKEDFPAITEFREGNYGSFLSRDLVLLRDLFTGLFGPERKEIWPVIKTYSRPYFHHNKNGNTTVTSDFVLNDLTPFFKNMARF